MRKFFFLSMFIGFASLAILTSCTESTSTTSRSTLEGKVSVDGSSTVYPITEAVAEEFRKVHPRVRVTVGIKGTGGGFKRFCAGETHINDASRLIKDSEATQAKAQGIGYDEIPVAYDGLAVVVHAENSFVDSLTIAELKEIWKPGSTVKKWSDVRPSFPDRPIHLYGPGTDSGTFDYFTKVVNGIEQACRPDFTASEDDNVLVHGVSGDKGSLGFFGFAYYIENQDKLKLLRIDGGSGAIAPSVETINNGTYSPLSRPVFIYVSHQASDELQVQEFVKFYLKNAGQLSGEVGYVSLPQETYQRALNGYLKRIGESGPALRAAALMAVHN